MWTGWVIWPQDPSSLFCLALYPFLGTPDMITRKHGRRKERSNRALQNQITDDNDDNDYLLYKYGEFVVSCSLHAWYVQDWGHAGHKNGASTGWYSCVGIGNTQYTSIDVGAISIRSAYHGGSIRLVPRWEMDTPRVRDAIIIQMELIGNGVSRILLNSFKNVSSSVQTLVSLAWEGLGIRILLDQGWEFPNEWHWQYGACEDVLVSLSLDAFLWRASDIRSRLDRYGLRAQ